MKENEFAGSDDRLTRQVLYADVRMNKEYLANDWDKWIFLASLEEARTLLSVEIYAFCVLDERIRVLAGGKEVKPRTIRRMLTAALERFEREAELIGEKDAIPSNAVIKAGILRIENARDAVEVLRYIHLTPFSEGYTIFAQEYWWTSFNNYRGHYNWEMVDIDPVIRYLSREEKRPLTMLADYHRRGEALLNPVPGCIRNGEFVMVPLGGARLPQGNINETFMVHKRQGVL